MYMEKLFRTRFFKILANRRAFYFQIAILCLLLVSCFDVPTDPVNPSNHNVQLVLTSSSGQVKTVNKL